MEFNVVLDLIDINCLDKNNAVRMQSNSIAILMPQCMLGREMGLNLKTTGLFGLKIKCIIRLTCYVSLKYMMIETLH